MSSDSMAADPPGGDEQQDLSLSTTVRSPWRNNLRRLFRQRSALTGMTILGFILFGAVFAPLIAPYDPNQVLIGAPGHATTAAVACTLRSSFEHLLAVRAGLGEELQDLFLFASSAPLDVPSHPELERAGWLGNEIFEPPADGIVLSDDLNPIDALNEPVARALRRASRLADGRELGE